MKNNGIHFETWNIGVLGPVVVHGLNQGDKDLSWQKWTYTVLFVFYYTDYVFLLVAYCLVDNYLIGFPFLLGWFKRGIHEFSLSG